jgi:preprotein translocase subunit SecB
MAEMKTSPLILHDYFVTELVFSVNMSFDADKATALCFDDLAIERELLPLGQDSLKWQMTLRVRQQAPPEKNTPYAFSLVLVGILEVSPNCPEDKRKQLAEVNGASMLFGAAREIIRSVTSRGPYLQILLPSVSFYQKREAPAAVPNSEAKAE